MLDAEQPSNRWVMWKGPHHRSFIAGDSSCDVQRAGASASTSFAANFPQAQTMANFPEATHDCLDLAGLLNEEQRAVQLRVRAFMVRLTPFCMPGATKCWLVCRSTCEYSLLRFKLRRHCASTDLCTHCSQL